MAGTLSIFFFSGTGNTERAASIVRDAAARAGWRSCAASIEGDAPAAETPSAGATEAGHSLLAFPVYAFSVPAIVKRFIRRLPREGGNGTWSVLAVCAGGGFGAAEQARRMLSRRGFSVRWSGSVAYPENWSQMSSPPVGAQADAWISEGDRDTRAAAVEILGGAGRRDRPAAGAAAWSWVVGLLFETLARRILGKTFIADERCTSCGQCERTCPAGAIRMAGSPARPVWGWGCEDCCRCINTCPERAVQTSAFRFFFHVGLNLALSAAAIAAAVGQDGQSPRRGVRSPVLSDSLPPSVHTTQPPSSCSSGSWTVRLPISSAARVWSGCLPRAGRAAPTATRPPASILRNASRSREDPGAQDGLRRLPA